MTSCPGIAGVYGSVGGCSAELRCQGVCQEAELPQDLAHRCTNGPAGRMQVAAEAWDPVFNPPSDDPPHAALRAYLELTGNEIKVADEFPMPAWDIQQFLYLLFV